MTKKRLDILVHEKKLVSTRAQATMLIKKSGVLVNGELCYKPGIKFSEQEASSMELELVEKLLYVSRGAYKLIEALKTFPIGSIENMVCADIGASTGGFTQVLLEQGAQKVYAIDVGHDQLALELKDDERVINLEGINARYPIALGHNHEKVDLIVSDLSHISLLKVLPEALNILKPGGIGIWLIKPQFEAGIDRIGKNGIVAEKLHTEIISEVIKGMRELGVNPLEIIESPIQGKKGNKEYLTYFIS